MIASRDDLDRRITFQTPTADTAPDSAGSEGWGDFATVWAQVQDVLPSRGGKQVEGGLSLTKRPARIRIRWRDDITSAMRVIFGSRTMQIIAGPAEIGGRRRWLEMMAEDFTSPGNPA